MITPPSSSGSPNRMCSAIAPPITSATSVAIATISACIQKASRAGRLSFAPIASGSERPVTRPSFADRYWTSPAITFARTITHSSAKPNCAPALMFAATLPGST